MPAPQKKKTPTKKITGPLDAPKRKKKGTKRLKKKSQLPQMIALATAVGIAGVVAVVATFIAGKAMPEQEKAPTNAVVRPVVEATVAGFEPRRPGLAAAAEDQIYYTHASDVGGLPIEAPVQGLLSREVITLFADGKFRPKEPIPRAEFASWCYNAMMAQTARGSDPFVAVKKPIKTVVATGQEFTDVAAEHWAASVLATLKGANYFGGADARRFRPDEPLTRAEWLALSAHFAGGDDVPQRLRAPLEDKDAGVAYRMLHYTDYADMPGAYKPYVQLVFGDAKRKAWVTDTFAPPVNPGPWRPNQPLTRGEAAGWIGQFYESLGRSGF